MSAARPAAMPISRPSPVSLAEAFWLKLGVIPCLARVRPPD